jgi:hypothetical protein
MNFKKGLGEEAFEKLASLRGEATKVAQEGTYQGYKNYETFTIAVTLENDEGSYTYWRERAEEIKQETENTGEEVNLSFAIADEIESQFREMAEEANVPEPFGTLLNSALDEVKWDEVAGSLLSD